MALAQEIDQRERTRLVGLMAYEGQIAGVGDNVPRKAINNLLIRAMQSAVGQGRRGAARRDRHRPLRGRPARVRERRRHRLDRADRRGVGGHRDRRRLGLLRPDPLRPLPRLHAPARGDVRSADRQAPGSRRGNRPGRRLPRLRRRVRRTGCRSPTCPPDCDWILTRAPGRSRRPCAARPRTGCGSAIGVYFRHVKAGELCERFNRLYLVTGMTIRDEVPTYRGEGKSFSVVIRPITE